MSHPSIVVDSFDKGFVVCPTGHIGGAEGESLDKEFDRLLALKPQVIVVDLAGTEMLSSAAISAMVRLNRITRKGGCKARLAAVPDPIMSLLKSVKLDDYIPVYASVSEAKR